VSRFRGRPASGPEAPPAPFVVGVGRSGTTLLRMMLDTHPELAIPPETQFVPELIDRGGEPPELVEAIVASRSWKDFGLEPGRLRALVSELERPAPADVLRAFYGLYAETHGKPRWGDKTPGYVKRMRPIAAALPEARFIHVIRDGRDVALSRRARGMGESKPIEEVAELWRRRIENARRQARRLRGRYLELRFEDLVSHPRAALERVCELIELPYDARMLDYHERAPERLAELGDLEPAGKRPERSRAERQAAHALAARPPSAARTEVWREGMDEEERRRYESVAGPLLVDLGYDVPSS
jgi:hypothetical protein